MVRVLSKVTPVTGVDVARMIVAAEQSMFDQLQDDRPMFQDVLANAVTYVLTGKYDGKTLCPVASDYIRTTPWCRRIVAIVVEHLRAQRELELDSDMQSRIETLIRNSR